MNQYKIFESPARRKEAVKQGWSWPAFFFHLIWAFVKKMYALGASVSVALFILLLLFGLIDSASGGKREKAIGDFFEIAGLITSIIFGVNGNAWREKNLISRGFDFKTVVTASSPEGATALYMMKEKQAS